ncbi:L-fucose permease Glucose/galactose transporter [Datura stramonium]|uniref:alpha-L-fucosidase n=1 Tax=Datura stramonium TaxID=4076 RepID=A0ABS8RQT1_DATST|nr:L-fucose permease Glucose/galactose transporter [Datura stramonium]
MIENKPITLNLKIIIILFLFQLSRTSQSSHPKPPPIPILPIPKAHQISWQNSEMALFLHFGPNTYTNSEWGTGHVDPSVFNPTLLNATQWVAVAKDSGFKRVVLTAKHHDGFCLWPSKYTDYSVKSSPWRNGSGDIVAELAEAARNAGLELGLYLSPWDRHEHCYGQTLEYNEFYMGQMTELLTRYGEIKYIFLDGAKGDGEKDMEYFFDDWFSLFHQLQPGASIFSDAGPDTRWVGNEAGVAGTTCWSLFNCSAIKIGADNDPIYTMEGDIFGHDWAPPQCDVSIRPGWFWHASEKPKSAMSLLDLYYKSVGRNCPLLLNVPPNSSGLISDEDIQVLKEFSDLRKSIFSRNIAKSALLSASSTRGDPNDSQFGPKNVIEEGLYTYWAPDQGQQSDWTLYLKFQQVITFNVLELQEPIQMGQRVIEFHLDMSDENGKWQHVVSGTTVGYRRLLLFPTVKSHLLRLVIDKSRVCPLISHLGIYMDSYSVSPHVSDTRTTSKFINDLVFRRTAYNQSQSASI